MPKDHKLGFEQDRSILPEEEFQKPDILVFCGKNRCLKVYGQVLSIISSGILVTCGDMVVLSRTTLMFCSSGLLASLE